MARLVEDSEPPGLWPPGGPWVTLDSCGEVRRQEGAAVTCLQPPARPVAQLLERALLAVALLGILALVGFAIAGWVLSSP